MVLKNILNDPNYFSKYEFQLKFKTFISEDKLLKLGAKKLGFVVHEDKYYVKDFNDFKNIFRIRKVNSEDLFFSYKLFVENNKVVSRKTFIKPLKDFEVKNIVKDYKELFSINKVRTIFILDNIIINVDKVENLGLFLEFEIPKREDYDKLKVLIEKLNLNFDDKIDLSYFDLALKNFDSSKKFLSKLHEKLSGFSFGISSAVLTTLGIIMGLNSATNSFLAVVSGIVSVAVSDSLSDSVSMYSSKKSERGVSSKLAFKSALNVFLGKFFFTLTFIVPFLFFSLKTAVFLSIILGLFLITIVSVQIAFVNEENIIFNIFKNLFLAFIVLLVSFLAGKFINAFF